MSTPPAPKTSLLRRISSDLGISLQALGVLIGVISVIVAIVGIVVTVKVTTREPVGAPPVSMPSSLTQTESSSSLPIPSPSPTTPSPTQTSEPTTSAPSEPATQAVTYADDYALRCRTSVFPILAGPASINGTDYAHTIIQWADDTSDSITIKRQALRFQATVGIRDDAPDQVRAQFELQGDGSQLFKSRVLSFGETQKVDVKVDGVLRITLRTKKISMQEGYAGWGDAQLTSQSALEC